MTEPTRPSLLLVDDDERYRNRLARALDDRGLDVRVAGNVAEARAEAERESPEMAVVDLRMPDGTGLELLRDLIALDGGTRVVMLTGWGSIATAVEAMRLGAHHYLPKPADAEDILAAFEKGDNPPLEATQDYRAPSLARAEWEHIQRVLADTGGNVSETARRLGIHRRTLQRKLQTWPPKD